MVFDDMFADLISDTQLQQIFTELFIKNRKLNISLICITLCYYKI